MHCVETASRKKERWGIGIGDPPVRGTEGPISWQALLLREVIHFHEGCVRDVMGTFSSGTALGLLPISMMKFAIWRLRKIRRTFKALGHLVTMKSGAWVVFSFIFPVAGNGEGRNKKNQQINIWWQQLGFTCLKQKNGSLHKGAVLTERALNWNEKG